MNTQIKALGIVGLCLVFFGISVVTYSAPLGSNSYYVYFSSDYPDGNGIYATTTDGGYVEKISSRTYNRVPGHLSLSEDNVKIAFESLEPEDPDEDVSIIDTSGENETNLTFANTGGHNAAEGPSFFAGEWLYFSSERSNYNGWLSAYRMLPDGSNVQSISPYPMSFSFTPAPDGQKLVRENADNWNTASRFEVTDPDGSNPQFLFSAPSGSGRSRGGAWLPNTNKIVLSAGPHEGNQALYMMDPNGSNVVNLGFPNANNWPLPQYRWGTRIKFFTNDGERIVFSANPSGNYDLFIQNIDGSDPVQLTDSPAYDYNPILTPDDKQILWLSESGGVKSIWAMDIDGQNKRRVTDEQSSVKSFAIGDISCQPPTITDLNATPNTLWPPNHKMIPVSVSVNHLGGCGTVSCQINSVTSNEPIDPDGDWKTIGDLNLNLRAERLGNGTGRIYTIGVQCTDSQGNSDSKTVLVVVPHDKGK